MSARPVRGAVAAAAVLAALLTLAGVAFAAHPVKGATYKGKLNLPGSVDPISFKVTANGERVRAFSLPYVPVGCQGGAFGSPKPGSAAAITRKGTFKATLTLYFAPAHRVNGKIIVTGTFEAHGKEKGKVSTVFTNHLFGKSCDKTVAYSTTG